MPISKNRRFRFLSLSALFCAAIYSLSSFCNAQTDGFSVARIHSDLNYNPEWETAPLSSEQKTELRNILDQKFSYLGFGGQCFAFASDDGKYVIKFFKHKIRKPYSYILNRQLPEPFEKKRLKKLGKAQFKLNRDFNSYKIAYEDLHDETGLVYIHLNKGKELNQSVTIRDKLGIEHQIALDDIEFIVQKRAQLAYAYIEELMDRGDTAAAKDALHALLKVIVSRCQKGVFDEDARIHRNFGFIDNRPIFIDVGRFRRDPERMNHAVYKKDLQDITGRFRDWLEEAHPILVPILDEEIYEFQSQS